jgi:DNA-binding transcriptional LysR family regulator
MNPDQLKTFLAVRKHLNFTRAAEERFLSQPAVSRQMQQLARELGAPLFEQIGKSLHLTDAGRTLAPLAEELLGNIDRAVEVTRAHRSARRGQLRIGASTTPGLYLLPSVLGQFHRTYPDVELRYSVENSSSIEKKIIRNELDLGFVGAHLSNDNLHSTSIADDEIICFVSSMHPLSSRSSGDVDRRGTGRRGGGRWAERARGSAVQRRHPERQHSQV